jgi:hypothetical protein
MACLHAANYSHRDTYQVGKRIVSRKQQSSFAKPRLDGLLVRQGWALDTLPHVPKKTFWKLPRKPVAIRPCPIDHRNSFVANCGWPMPMAMAPIALLYGASPFECEFRRHHHHHHHHHHSGGGTTSSSSSIKIVDCSQLRVLGNLPTPPKESEAAKWYSPELLQLVEWILHKDRRQRPTLDNVQARVEALLHPPLVSHPHHHHDVEDPMDLFVHSRNVL